VNNNLVIPSHFGKAITAPIRPSDRKIGISPIEYKLSYINNLPVPITVVWRSGLKFVLPTQFSMTCNKLIIRTEIILNHSVKDDIQRVLSSLDDESSDELKVIKETFSFQINENKYNGVMLVIDYPVTLKMLNELGGTIYFHELDCLLSLNDFESTPPHPFSYESMKLKEINSVIDINEPVNSRFNYSIELVDNAGKFGQRYLNIGNKIYRIDTIKNSTKEDGVYVVSNNPVSSELEVSSKTSIYYSFEDAETKIGLYKTIEDAAVLGDTAMARKRDIEILEHNTAKMKIDLQNIKHEHELLLAEKAKDAQLLEMERAQHTYELEELRKKTEHDLKIEREKIKDFYTTREYDRKDSNETLKFIPAIIATLGGLAMIIKSFK
jgi:hypothetical protein